MNIKDIKNLPPVYLTHLCMIRCVTQEQCDRVIKELVKIGFTDQYNRGNFWKDFESSFVLVPGSDMILNYEKYEICIRDDDFRKLPEFWAEQLLVPTLEDILIDLDKKILKMEERSLK